MELFLIWASNILVFTSYLTYEWAMLKGRAKPHRTTRLVLLVITALGFFSSLAQGNTAVAWFLGVCSVQSLVMFLMSIKYGYGGWEKIDIVCLVIATVGIVLWKTTSNPILGVYSAVVADLVGMVPALIKTYRLPDTEYWLTYVFDLSAIVLTTIAVTGGAFNDYLYPVYLLAVNGLMLFFILRPKLIPKTI